MIRSSVLKWAAAGAFALVSIPAIGMARHASHVSATSLKAITTVTPAASTHAVHATKAVSHKAKANAKPAVKSKKKAKRHAAKKHVVKKHVVKKAHKAKKK